MVADLDHLNWMQEEVAANDAVIDTGETWMDLTFKVKYFGL